MKVLHVIPSMAAEVGGPPAVCAGLAGAMASRGHAVAMATVESPGENAVPTDPTVTRHAFSPDAPGGYLKSTSLDDWLRKNVGTFDVVHLHSLWQFPTYAGARACWAAKVPYVVLLNGMLDRYSVRQRSALKKRIYWLLRERKIHARAAALHCLNRAEVRKAVPWIADFPKFILGNGIDAGQLAALPPRGHFRAAHPEFATAPLVLFLSRVHPKKGLDRLIPAWKAVAEKMPDARLLIAGTGDATYVAALDRLIADAGLQKQIVRLGQLVGPAKWEALVDADVFVLPSHQEGFSMAITEALAAGCVPVVTEECNFDELSNAASGAPSGIIIKDADMRAFTAAVFDLLQNPPRHKALAVAGQSLVSQHYTWQKIAADLEINYQQAIDRKPFDSLQATCRVSAGPSAP